ncbi:hypothetical protein L1987_48384 [Smallanthus sonchifolius]|uniref:Uncharacterized protein n=1 Tax=Smallanthus sonchifolius TaxID=185202 RepID=A0ACB9FTF4_9ASTR|nr:hypothetical protein L1987_48384 [Smallanthus sonchifolius]
MQEVLTSPVPQDAELYEQVLQPLPIQIPAGDMCTLEKCGNIFFLTLTGDAAYEHRLNPTHIASIRTALAEAKSQSTHGTFLITGADGKFFSNGFDLAWAKSAAGGSLSEAVNLLRHMVDLFKDFVADLISMRMLTIAAVTGHAQPPD